MHRVKKKTVNWNSKEEEEEESKYMHNSQQQSNLKWEGQDGKPKTRPSVHVGQTRFPTIHVYGTGHTTFHFPTTLFIFHFYPSCKTRIKKKRLQREREREGGTEGEVGCGHS
jgi:hypothetical protein